VSPPPESKRGTREGTRPRAHCKVQIITQNANGCKEIVAADGTRTNEKFETIAQQMRRDETDAWMIQETWLTGNSRVEIQGTTFFHHGLEEKTCNRGRGGVAIAIRGKAMTAWVEAGMPEPIMPGDIGDGCTRIMGIDLDFQEHKRVRKVTMFNVYAPNAESKTDEEIQSFYDKLEDIVQASRVRGREIIMGGDFNACIGRRKEGDEEEKRTVGPFGNEKRNSCGEKVISMAIQTKLKVTTSFFRHHHYSTFKGNRRHDKSRQLDYFLTEGTLSTKIIDAKRCDHKTGCRSDHLPVKLTMRFGYEHNHRTKKRAEKETTEWKKLDDPECEKRYQEKLDGLLQSIANRKEMSSEKLSEAIIKAGKATCSAKVSARKGWFEMSEHKLLPAIEKRNLAMARNMNKQTERTKEELREAWRETRKRKKEAIRHWTKETAKDISRKVMSMNPKLAWKRVRELEAGLTGHHKCPKTTRFKNTEGNEASNDCEEADNASEHFKKVYNRSDAPVDFSVLQDIEQRQTLIELDDEPTVLEIVQAIKVMRSDAAPGKSGVIGKCLKHCSGEAITAIHEVITAYWRDEQVNPQWQIASLSIIYKGKGDQKNLNNHRGVALQDLMSRLLSSILSRRLLDGPIALYGTQAQFGSQTGVGCRDAIFTIRSMLQLRRYHNLPTWTLYVDLVKAFDTANHQLLFKLLQKFGVPEHMTGVIERLYKDAEIEIKIGKENRTIPYSVGVKQGDNMAPVLFLFLMQALSETLEREWKENNIAIPEFKHFPKSGKGRLLGQDWRAKGMTFQMYYLLYVDDGAFNFENKEDMIKASKLIRDTMKRFGLIMHIGENGGKSKTEAMYYPPTLEEASKMKNETPGEDEATFTVDEGYITFTRKFKYLGSVITQDLKDNDDISRRINQANAQVRGLTNIWMSKDITTEFKKLLYIQLPLNTALWGAESWTLTADNERKLETFHHKSIRRILNINMFEVEAGKITNTKLRTAFGKIRNISEFIHERQLNWLGHLLHLPDSRQTKKLVNAWVANPRRGKGQPQHLLRHSFRKALIAAGEIGEEDKKAAFKDWRTDIQSVTLEEWRAQSKKRLRQGMLLKERHLERQRTQTRIQATLAQRAEVLTTGN
jgi:exonuclease III